MTLRKPRIFYVGMVCTDAYVKAIREDAFVGAASGKMSSVVSALRLAGRRSVLVSLPFVGKGRNGSWAACAGVMAFPPCSCRCGDPRRRARLWAFLPWPGLRCGGCGRPIRSSSTIMPSNISWPC